MLLKLFPSLSNCPFCPVERYRKYHPGNSAVTKCFPHHNRESRLLYQTLCLFMSFGLHQIEHDDLSNHTFPHCSVNQNTPSFFVFNTRLIYSICLWLLWMKLPGHTRLRICRQHCQSCQSSFLCSSNRYTSTHFPPRRPLADDVLTCFLSASL